MIREYIVRYAKARGISEDEAYKHQIVKEYCNFVGGELLKTAKVKQAKEQIRDAGRNAEVESRAKCEGD